MQSTLSALKKQTDKMMHPVPKPQIVEPSLPSNKVDREMSEEPIQRPMPSAFSATKNQLDVELPPEVRLKVEGMLSKHVAGLKHDLAQKI